MKPVVKPLIIEFQGSSFPRMWANVQSAVVNIRPHMEKLPANKIENNIQRIIATVASSRVLQIVGIHCCLVSILQFQLNNTSECRLKFISSTFSESRRQLIDALYDNRMKNWDLDFTIIWVYSTLQHFTVKSLTLTCRPWAIAYNLC